MAEAQIQHDAVVAPGVETRSRRQDFLRTFFSNRLAMFGTALMTVFILMAIFAPLIAPYDPLRQGLADGRARRSRTSDGRGNGHRARGRLLRPLVRLGADAPDGCATGLPEHTAR